VATGRANGDSWMKRTGRRPPNAEDVPNLYSVVQPGGVAHAPPQPVAASPGPGLPGARGADPGAPRPLIGWAPGRGPPNRGEGKQGAASVCTARGLPPADRWLDHRGRAGAVGPELRRDRPSLFPVIQPDGRKDALGRAVGDPRRDGRALGDRALESNWYEGVRTYHQRAPGGAGPTLPGERPADQCLWRTIHDHPPAAAPVIPIEPRPRPDMAMTAAAARERQVLCATGRGGQGVGAAATGG